MYKVIVDFLDLQDNNYSYRVGDTFPRDEAVVMSARYKELASNKNRRGIPLIEEIPDPVQETKEKPKKTAKK